METIFMSPQNSKTNELHKFNFLTGQKDYT